MSTRRAASRVFAELDLRDADAVIDALRRGAQACRDAACRRAGAGSIELVRVSPADRGTAGGRLIATGDLHDHPLHLMRLCRAAGLEPPPADDGSGGGALSEVDGAGVSHLTLHELIHGERLTNGMDFSYRVLARAAALKAEHPEFVHVLLANHELAQATGQQVAKDGVRCNQAFDEALDTTFDDRADDVRAAVRELVMSLPLAVVFAGAGEDGVERRVLCAHSLPSPETMSRAADAFEPGVLERALETRDYTARVGSAHMMVWGRGQTDAQIRTLGERWGIDLFVLGHEKAPEGTLVLSEQAAVLNSDHDRGVYVPIDLGESMTASGLAERAVALSGG